MAKKPKKKAPSEKPPAKPEKVTITPKLRNAWLRVRKAWNWSYEAFSSTLSMLTDEEAELLYGVVRLSLFKDSYVQMLQKHPELKEIVKSDDDRLCMHDSYEALSFRLNKEEKLPGTKKVIHGIKGRIGRDAPVFE